MHYSKYIYISYTLKGLHFISFWGADSLKEIYEVCNTFHDRTWKNFLKNMGSFTLTFWLLTMLTVYTSVLTSLIIFQWFIFSSSNFSVGHRHLMLIGIITTCTIRDTFIWLFLETFTHSCIVCQWLSTQRHFNYITNNLEKLNSPFLKCTLVKSIFSFWTYSTHELSQHNNNSKRQRFVK